MKLMKLMQSKLTRQGHYLGKLSTTVMIVKERYESKCTNIITEIKNKNTKKQSNMTDSEIYKSH